MAILIADHLPDVLAEMVSDFATERRYYLLFMYDNFKKPWSVLIDLDWRMWYINLRGLLHIMYDGTLLRFEEVSDSTMALIGVVVLANEDYRFEDGIAELLVAQLREGLNPLFDIVS